MSSMDSLVCENPNPAATQSTLRVIVARHESEWQGLQNAWDHLAADIPFRTWDWNQTWWRHYQGPSRELLTLLVKNEHDQLVGVAPWYVDVSARGGRVVRFLGSGEVCSDYLTLLARPDQAGTVAACVAEWLAGPGADEWHLLDLTGVEAADSTIGGLVERLAERGHVAHRQADMNCWRVRFPETWDQFLTTVSKSRRDRARTLLRRKVDSGQVAVRQVQTPSELERAFDILIDLHQKRRQSLDQDGCFASRQFTEFHREITARMLAAGRLRMLWTELDGRPLTVEYGLTGGDTIFYYQGGFEPELASESPGWISMATTLRLAIEQGYRHYDFLRGDEAYKSSWRGVAQPLVRVRVVGRRSSARARFATTRTTEVVRGWARRLLSKARKAKE